MVCVVSILGVLAGCVYFGRHPQVGGVVFAERDLGTGGWVGLVDQPTLEVDDRGGGWEGGR